MISYQNGLFITKNEKNSGWLGARPFWEPAHMWGNTPIETHSMGKMRRRCLPQLVSQKIPPRTAVGSHSWWCPHAFLTRWCTCFWTVHKWVGKSPLNQWCYQPHEYTVIHQSYHWLAPISSYWEPVLNHSKVHNHRSWWKTKWYQPIP